MVVTGRTPLTPRQCRLDARGRWRAVRRCRHILSHWPEIDRWTWLTAVSCVHTHWEQCSGQPSRLASPRHPRSCPAIKRRCFAWLNPDMELWLTSLHTSVERKSAGSGCGEAGEPSAGQLIETDTHTACNNVFYFFRQRRLNFFHKIYFTATW